MCHARQDKKGLREYFRALQDYCSDERDMRLRTKNLRETLNARNCQKAIRKWRLRMEKTKRVRAFLARGTLQKKKLDLRSVMLAWRQEFFVDKDISLKVTRLVQMLATR